jgi:holliday junction DNA helicase RuvA
MIAILNGKVEDQLADMIILDVGGVGYGLWVPKEDWANLPKGREARLYIYEHIREQNYDLYGFSSVYTKKLFEQLLSVNGVGPKMALAILSIGTIEEVRMAIAEGNVRFLQSASGVGKKVAERVIVDLKDKVGMVGSSEATTFLSTPAMNRFDEAQSALVALGYSAQDAAEALNGIDVKLSTEERLKLALKGHIR